MPLVRRGPWYRGGVPRSYVPPTVFVSVGYAICLVFFSIFFILAGGIMLGVSGNFSDFSSDPRFDTEFFRKHKSPDPTNILKIIGPVFMGIGFFMLLIAIGLCVAVACIAKKQEDKRHKRMEQTQQPLTGDDPLQPPPASAYPHQQQPQNIYPPAGSYPSQQPSDQYPPGSYPPQYPQSQYPPQPPAGYYPPPTSYMPPSEGSPYPPPSYPQPMYNVPPENLQYTSGTQPSSEFTKQA